MYQIIYNKSNFATFLCKHQFRYRHSRREV